MEKNKYKCNLCGDIVESQKDKEVKCSCGNLVVTMKDKLRIHSESGITGFSIIHPDGQEYEFVEKDEE